MTSPDQMAADEVDIVDEVTTTGVGLDKGLVAELAWVSDRLKALSAEERELKERKRQVGAKLLEYFEANDLTAIVQDGRNVYTHNATYPSYRQRPAEEGGGRYTSDDVVEVFRALGREDQIKPETVNHQTLGAVLREYGDAVPAELSEIVELQVSQEVRIGAPKARG